MEDRRRSVARFEGELFYEPDDIPDDIDATTADELRHDRAVGGYPSQLLLSSGILATVQSQAGRHCRDAHTLRSLSSSV